ncbi:MAG: iron donor protein CyaY [Sulfuricella sp.]|nr:iron donor protein CyaY [Sulfuricella sp.]
MTESEFKRAADEILARIEDAIDHCDVDIECENNGGVLDLTFANGSHIIVNKQGATQEIWLAAKSGGYHFRWEGGMWRDTRDGSEFFAALNRWASEQAGEAVTLG